MNMLSIRVAVFYVTLVGCKISGLKLKRAKQVIEIPNVGVSFIFYQVNIKISHKNTYFIGLTANRV